MRWWCLLLLFAPWLVSMPAHAQIGLTAAIESDYRFRGFSLSDGRPDLRLSLTYDGENGIYAGATLIGDENQDGHLQSLGYVDYIGYVRHSATGPSWDVGVTQTHFDGEPFSGYTEIYAGVSKDHLSARLSYSANYFHKNARWLYAEINNSVRLSPHWLITEHLGLMTPIDTAHRPERYDARIGLTREFTHYALQAAWTTQQPDVRYPYARAPGGDALVVSALCFF